MLNTTCCSCTVCTFITFTCVCTRDMMHCRDLSPSPGKAWRITDLSTPTNAFKTSNLPNPILSPKAEQVFYQTQEPDWTILLLYSIRTGKFSTKQEVANHIQIGKLHFVLAIRVCSSGLEGEHNPHFAGLDLGGNWEWARGLGRKGMKPVVTHVMSNHGSLCYKPLLLIQIWQMSSKWEDALLLLHITYSPFTIFVDFSGFLKWTFLFHAFSFQWSHFQLFKDGVGSLTPL